ncbi:unnamed protein product [Candidula unifasciata]|uniref:Ras association domain-containing protein 1 n=1 Tax=Candidula unifasciata TaxID=100452 RepID=A0A8S3YVI6_9EUPU|nr:unnamed protein product [Candidula unifasciata]
MEFLNEDEHFLEFEQVFEAVRNRRISRDIDTCHLSNQDIISSHIDTLYVIASSVNSGPRTKLDSAADDHSVKDVQQPSLVGDIFADFFDNDESFLEFENEFEKFRSGRRSYFLESCHDGSSRDVIGDLDFLCDKDVRSYTKNGVCSQDNVDSYRSFLCSAKDWTKMLRKIRRSSCISEDSVTDKLTFRHRLSVGEMSADDKRTKDQHKAYSVSDLRRFPCQYTCHEHCVPEVTLSCKSVSGDGCDIAAARTPSPPDPKPHGEACLFMGGIQARPGAARIVSSSPADTPASGAARTSESTPNFQYLAQGRGHMDTPRPPNILLHHRSWSISEDIVTPHSYPIQHSGITQDSARHSSAAPSASSLPCQPSYSNSRFDSFPRGNTSGRSQLYPGASTTEPDCVDEGVILSQHAKGGDRPGGEAPALDLSDEKDETDSGYRSGTIPDDKLPRVPSQATLDQQELKRKAAKFNHFVPAACLEVTGKESFQGFLKVTMNLVRPITMELGARPPSIYELLTREHIVEENTQQVAFYMPRDTHKSLHITSDTTTKEVVASLLKKFHILDHPRKFAMYEQEFSDRNKLVRLRRLTDKDFPLRCLVTWDPERIKNYRMVLQENETGEIVWDAFSLPELNNFLRVLDREEKETVIDLKYKYAYMKQYMERRLVELRGECAKKSKSKT